MHITGIEGFVMSTNGGGPAFFVVGWCLLVGFVGSIYMENYLLTLCVVAAAWLIYRWIFKDGTGDP